LIHFKGGDISQTLLKINVTIQDNALCAKQYPSQFVGDHQLCASAPGKDTCQVGHKPKFEL
jgi:trypsin